MLIKMLHQFDAEHAHRLALCGLRLGLVRTQQKNAWPRLKTTLTTLALPNPLGLAAGFDKNAEVLSGLSRLGFGWLEVGTITPRPQVGNPKPRIFRLPADRALINRLGFNNEGLEAAKRRLAQRRLSFGIVGANIGANKTSSDPAEDYVICLNSLYCLADYFTVNVSSPNTPGLRDLQGRAKLTELLERLMTARAKLEQDAGRKPLFLKLAPDLAEEDEADVAEVVMSLGIDALIISNTTLDRPSDLVDANRQETGGLSGRPLFDRSTDQIRRFRKLTKGSLPLIGVGGIDSGKSAYEKIKAGASALQLYSGFVYGGPSLIPEILNDLDASLRKDGIEDLQAAIGRDVTPATV
ncbi:MAG: quinone-dependent dihydroorotate dehydrogenase [Geminicoccales bacterium]